MASWLKLNASDRILQLTILSQDFDVQLRTASFAPATQHSFVSLRCFLSHGTVPKVTFFKKQVSANAILWIGLNCACIKFTSVSLNEN